ncbi:MAG: hypothetical protein M3Q07_16365 [Pseudobdellovibrionaceae bacterium]|nr:hypothetical protein [Pseudobdellovibrionaceae bacterium]
MKYALLILLGLLQTQLFANPEITVDITDESGFTAMHPYARVIKDDSSRIMIDELIEGRHENRWQPLDESASFGFYEGTVWVRFTVHNPSPLPLKSFLQIDCAILSDITLYEVADHRVLREKVGGLKYPGRPNYDVNNRIPTYVLALDPGQTKTIYLRAASSYPFELPIHIMDRATFAKRASGDRLAFGLFMGVVLVMALYNLVIFGVLNDRVYLYYSLTILCTHFGAIMGSFGILHAYLASLVPRYSNELIVIAEGASCFFGVYFFLAFLRAENEMPRMYRMFRLWAAASFIAMVLPFIYFNLYVTMFANSRPGSRSVPTDAHACWKSSEPRLARVFSHSK